MAARIKLLLTAGNATDTNGELFVDDTFVRSYDIGSYKCYGLYNNIERKILSLLNNYYNHGINIIAFELILKNYGRLIDW